MSILIEALFHIVRRPVQALIIMALPLILNVAAEVYSAHRYVISDYSEIGFSNMLVVLANFIATAVIAVSWHRLVLMGETAALVPRAQSGLYFRYFVQWFVVGLIIALFTLLLCGAVYGIVWLLPLNGIGDEPTIIWFYATGLAPLGSMFATALGISVYCWLFFRCAVTLPHLALGRGEMQIREGWRATRPLNTQIAIAAILAGLFQAAVMWVQTTGLMLVMLDADGYVPVSFDYVSGAFFGLSYTILPLLGASILTAIYAKLGL